MISVTLFLKYLTVLINQMSRFSSKTGQSVNGHNERVTSPFTMLPVSKERYTARAKDILKNFCTPGKIEKFKYHNMYCGISFTGGDKMEFELSIEALEEVSPKHPVLPGCSSKPLNLCKLA